MSDNFSILALIAAGAIREDDGVLAMIQNLERDQAEAIANWLVLATQGPVKLRWMSFEGVHEIVRAGPEEVPLTKVKTDGKDPA